MISKPIYKRDTSGRIRTWQFEVRGDSYRTIAGIHGGTSTISEWTKCKAKNKGKSNATTPEQQALAEGVAGEEKRLRREYRRTVPELEFVPDGPMLARSYEKLKEPLRFPVFSQPKLDGIRAIVNRHGAFSRDYQPHLNCEHILKLFEPVFEKYPDLVFDGEFYNHTLKDDFNEIVSIVRTTKPSEDDKQKSLEIMQYHVYDMVNENRVFDSRQEDLNLLFRKFNNMYQRYGVCLVPTELVHDQEALDKLNDSYVEEGYEGQMIRLNAPYECDIRSKSLIKRKEFYTEEFPILSIEEGSGNWSGYAKCVLLKVNGAPDNEVGSGMRGTQEFAKRILDERSRYKFATVRHRGRTPDGSLLFPVVIDFHDARGRVD